MELFTELPVELRSRIAEMVIQVGPAPTVHGAPTQFLVINNTSRSKPE